MLEIHDVLRNLREKKGLTQTELARLMGISRDTVARIETASQKLTVDYLLRFAGALNMHPVDIFRRLENESRNEFVYLLRAHGSSYFTEDIRSEYEGWYNRMEELSAGAQLPRLREIPVKDFGVIEENDPFRQGILTARWLRKKWKMGNDPVTDPVGLMESLGYYITGIDLGDNDIFAITGRKGESGRPGIVINIHPSIPVERQHFSIIHELGHLVKHGEHFEEQPEYSGVGRNKDDREKFADAFAAEFLVPSEELKSLYRQIPVSYSLEKKAFILKGYFRVSYQTVLIQLFNSGVLDITKDQFWKYYGYLKNKYGKHEPMPIRQRLEFRQELELKELADVSGNEKPEYDPRRSNRMVRFTISD